jgi:endonuclease-3
MPPKIPPNDLAAQVLTKLSARYPLPQTQLDWKDPWELLVATVLSAQCTDIRVNAVTPIFFSRWPDPHTLAKADIALIEKIIHSTGFFRNKAKHLRQTAQILVTKYNGQVPRTMAELVALPGIARKTANIVLSNAFGIHEGIAVDTHVARIARRLGLTSSTNPVQIEKDLMPLFPRAEWGNINHRLVLFGREICTSRKPKCSECELADICPSFLQI